MASPNDGSPSALPSDDSGRYAFGGWDPVNSVWRALKAAADRSLFVLTSKGTAANTQVTVTTSSGTVLAANANRKVATIYNRGPSEIFLKSAAGATTGTDYPLPAGAEYVDDHTTSIWTAICASGTADVRVREVS